MFNTFKTFVFLAVLTFLFIAAGGAVGGEAGMVWAFIIALAMNSASYWFSDKIVLKMYGAREVPRTQAPGLYRILEKLCSRAKIPIPRLYLIANETPNAFATGRNPSNAAVALTQGLVNLLSEDEIEGVIAHELAHVKNRDILIATVAATFAGAIMLLSRLAYFAAIFGAGGRSRSGGGGLVMLLTMIFAPVAALLIQMAISRSEEYKADASGAVFSGKPLSLASGLEKLEEYSKRRGMAASPATAHMFIVNPLRGGGVGRLFSTHPPVAERASRLRKLAGNLRESGRR